MNKEIIQNRLKTIFSKRALAWIIYSIIPALIPVFLHFFFRFLLEKEDDFSFTYLKELLFFITIICAVESANIRRALLETLTTEKGIANWVEAIFTIWALFAGIIFGSLMGIEYYDKNFVSDHPEPISIIFVITLVVAIFATLFTTISEILIGFVESNNHKSTPITRTTRKNKKQSQ